jgi:hypothetical protein
VHPGPLLQRLTASRARTGGTPAVSDRFVRHLASNVIESSMLEA